MDTENRVEALAGFLEVENEEIENGFDDTEFCFGNEEYMVLTNDEADEKVKEYIRESVWAFQSYFIKKHIKSNLSGEAIDKIQSELCEDANDIILALIDDFDNFVEDAISVDGRGHFLSFYDGEESEFEYQGETIFIYRVN